MLVQCPFPSAVSNDFCYPCMTKEVFSFPGASIILRDEESHKDFIIQAIMIFFKKELKAPGKVVVSDFLLPQNSGEPSLRTHYNF